MSNTGMVNSAPFKISLVTCSYQQGQYLEATLRSVLSQRYPLLEYIVIDGGSTDNSVDVIRAHESQLAHWVSEQDHGQTDALIKGFTRSTGDIMGWLCSDDLLLPNTLQRVAEYFAMHPEVDAMYGDSLWIDEHGEYLRPKKEMPFNRFVFLFDHNFIPQPSMFWRRGLYEAVGGLNASFNVAMDGDLWERFSARGRIAHVPEYLSCMRYYRDQKTRRLRDQAERENALIRDRGLKSKQPAVVNAMLHGCARAARWSLKALRGGYGARVPHEHIDWLQSYAGAK